MAALRAGAVVVVGEEVEVRRRGRRRVFPPGTLGTVLLPPDGGYVVIEFDPAGDGGGWLADVPLRCVEETRTGVAA